MGVHMWTATSAQYMISLDSGIDLGLCWMVEKAVVKIMACGMGEA